MSADAAAVAVRAVPQARGAMALPAYACVTRRQRYGEPLCQSLTIEHVDRALGEAFLAVIQPAQAAAALALAEDVERDRAAAQPARRRPGARSSRPSLVKGGAVVWAH